MVYRFDTFDLDSPEPIVVRDHPLRVDVAVHTILQFKHGDELGF